MIINEFFLNSEEEAVVKVVREALSLCRIEIASEKAGAYKALRLKNDASEADGIVTIATQALFTLPEGTIRTYEKRASSERGERPASAKRRLIKLNVYDILRSLTRQEPALWGILHGVRPVKIVHRLIREGRGREEIAAKLQRDYAVSAEKIALLLRVAYRQLPFLALSSPKTVSVYIGIPFCPSRCLYCSFPSYVLPPREKLEAFLAVLRKDLLAARAIVERYRLKVQTIYVGGGTPTSLPDEDFAAFLRLVCASFRRPETVEFTVEAGRPDSVNGFKISVMKECGVNRVSVNPQTMQQKTLDSIGRKHTAGAIIELFGKFRAAGMRNINMDLILGLPGETLPDAEDTLRQVLALRPDDLTIHALALKRGSRLKMDLERHPLPDDETVRQMFASALRQVEASGLAPYYLYRQGYMSGDMENIGCCREGAEGLYNIQIMEEKQTILGVGPAATTKVVYKEAYKPLGASFNAKDLITYMKYADRYIARRAALLEEAFGGKEE